MASKQVSEILIKLGIDGLQGLDKLKSSFRELEKSIGPSAATIERARESIIAYGKEGRNSEQVIKGQVEALKGLRSQTERGSAIWAELTRDIENFRQASRRTDEEISVLRESILSVAAGSNQSQQSLRSYIADLGRLRNEATITGSVFSALGNDISELTARLEQAETQTTQTGRAFGRVLGQALASTSAGARKQIQDLKLLIDEQQEFIDNIDSLASGERRLKHNVEARAAAQERLNRALAQQRQLTFQESARAGRQTVRSAAAAFADPDFLRTISPEALDKRLGELPNTTAGLNQGLSELSERLANTKRNTVDYLVVAMQMAGVQRELTAVTQGYAQSLLMGIRTGTVAPSARNLQEVITALRAEMSQLDVTTSEGARAYAENAREARALEQQLNGLANAYRHVGDMAAQAATAETSAATARITANYLNRPLIRQQEQAMAELGQRVRAGVAATPLALPAAGQTTAPGTGLPISGEYVQPGYRAHRPEVQKFFARSEVGEAQIRIPGQPVGYGPQATEEQAERARRLAISEGDAARAAIEQKDAIKQAEEQVKSYRAEIDKARRADIGSIDSTQRLREAIGQYRSTLPGASAEFKKLTKELGELDARSEKLGRGLARRRMTGMQVAQAAGAAVSGGIFGGPEGFFGGALGGIFGGVGGAFAGAAAGAQVGALRQQLGGFADYAAQIQKMEIALNNAAGSQDQFNQAMAAASAATRNLNVPQDVAIQGMTKLTAAVKGAGGQVSDAELVFNNVTAAIKATGGSAQDVDGAITAMVQVFSKGKVSAEELSGQLGERLPGAVTKFAQANEMTLPELQKALEQGQVGLNELMNFIVQLGDEYAGVAGQIASSSQDAGARLTVAFNDMRIAVGEALQPIGAEFQEAFIPFIESITPALVAVLPVIGDLALGVAKNLDVLAASLGALAVGAIVNAINLTGGLAVAFASLKTAILATNAVLLLNPWVALAAGIAAATVAIIKHSQAQKEYNNLLDNGASNTNELRSTQRDLETQITAARKALEGSANGMGATGRRAMQLKMKIAELENQLARINKTFTVRLRLEREGFEFDESGQAKSYTVAGVTYDVKTGRPISGTQTPNRFPQLTNGDSGGSAKSAADKAARDEQRIQERLRNLAIETESIIKQALFKGRIAEAEIVGNKELAIRLRGEARAQQISQELERSLIGITDERVKQALLVKSQAEIESAGIDTAIELEQRRLAVIKEQNDELFRRAGFTPQDAMRDGAGAFDPSLPDLRVSPAESQMNKYRKELEALSNPISMAVTGANAIGDAFGQAFQNIVTGSQSTQQALSDAFKAIGEAFIQMATEIIAKQIAMIVFQTILKALGGSSSFGFSGAGPAQLPSGAGFAQGFSMPSLLANADGNVYAQNGIQPFAMGGIVTKPTFFKYADGGTFNNGVMGEAGPEAIMPLKRGADGKLGVAARLDGAMKRYRATPGSAAAIAEGDATAGGNAAGATMEPIDVRYSVERINNVDYVTADQFQRGMAQAAQQGAVQGERRALTTLRQNTSQRKRIGI